MFWTILNRFRPKKIFRKFFEKFFLVGIDLEWSKTCFKTKISILKFFPIEIFFRDMAVSLKFPKLPSKIWEEYTPLSRVRPESKILPEPEPERNLRARKFTGTEPEYEKQSFLFCVILERTRWVELVSTFEVFFWPHPGSQIEFKAF